MVELLTPSSYAADRLKVRYTPMNGDWFIENKSSDVGNVKADSTYGTKRASAYRIMEDTLNLRDTRIHVWRNSHGSGACPRGYELPSQDEVCEVLQSARAYADVP